MLVGGLRALLVQALNPLAMAAMDQHSDFRTDPWGRLSRTSEYVTTTIFGTTEQARAAGARVRAIHRRISGIDPVTRGAYRADDPELLLWIHAAEVDSFLAAYRAYGGGLSEAEGNRYVAEMTRVGELVGLHAEDLPASMAELRDYLADVKTLCVTPAAREGLRLVISPPVPALGRLLWAVPSTATVAILPDRVRDLYGLSWIDPASAVVRLGAASVNRVLRALLPTPPAIRQALERASAVEGAPEERMKRAAPLSRSFG
jgi:uncharacterized protein (DUF2236 family)